MKILRTVVENTIIYATPIILLALIVIGKFEARRVRLALVDETKDRNTRLDKIHALVNSDMGRQKRMVMQQAERIARMTSDPGDIAFAQEAREIYEEHMSRQKDSDSIDSIDSPINGGSNENSQP